MMHVVVLCVLMPAALSRLVQPNPIQDPRSIQDPTHIHQHHDHSSSEQFIIGGQAADEAEWPYQGFVYYYNTMHCGVTLISDRWVLTAAHCVISGSVGAFEVGLGYTNRRTDKGSRYTVEEAIAHPLFDYYNSSKGYDVGVMRLSRPVVFTQAVRPVSLAKRDAFNATTPCYITGWGLTAGGGRSFPADLQEARVQVMSGLQCEAFHGEGRVHRERHLCAGVVNSVVACNGDSGGPAVCWGDEGWVQVGITSFGTHACQLHKPTVYTRVSHYYSWIQDNCDSCMPV